MKSKRFVTAVLLPTFIWVVVFTFIPIVAGIVISFLDYNPLRSTNTFVGLSNFAKLFDDPTFIKSLTNTVTFVFFCGNY